MLVMSNQPETERPEMTRREYWAEQRRTWDKMPGRTLISLNVFIWTAVGSLPVDVTGVVVGDQLVASVPLIVFVSMSIVVAIGCCLPERAQVTRPDADGHVHASGGPFYPECPVCNPSRAARRLEGPQ